jgi:hypothetical protein
MRSKPVHIKKQIGLNNPKEHWPLDTVNPASLESDTSSDSDSEDYIRMPARKRRAYRGAIDYEDRFIKHGSIGPYHTYDIKTADDYMTHRGPLRNDPRREKQGIINQRRALRKYYEDDHDEHRDWWGNNDY